MVIQRLLFGVLDVAVTCVHELVEDICRYRSAFDPLEPRLGCLIMLSSIPRRLFSDVLLAAEPAARRASARRLQSFTDRAFRTQQDRTSLRKAHHTALGTYPCVPHQWRMLHTRLQGNSSQIVGFYASSRPALTQWRNYGAKCSDVPP